MAVPKGVSIQKNIARDRASFHASEQMDPIPSPGRYFIWLFDRLFCSGGNGTDAAHAKIPGKIQAKTQLQSGVAISLNIAGAGSSMRDEVGAQHSFIAAPGKAPFALEDQI